MIGWVSAERSDVSLSLGLKKERWRLLTGLLLTVAVICLTKLLLSASGVTALVFLMVYLVRHKTDTVPADILIHNIYNAYATKIFIIMHIMGR